MKKSILILITAMLFCAVSEAQFGRIYPIKNKNVITQVDKGLIGADTSSYEFYSVDSSFFFGPSAGFSLVTVANNGDMGVMSVPGVGYGFKWKPSTYKGNYLLGLDLFLNAAYSESDGYTSISASPVLWFLNWFGVSYGWERQFYTDGSAANIWRGGMVVGINF